MKEGIHEFGLRTFVVTAPYSSKQYFVYGGLPEVAKVVRDWKKYFSYPPEFYEVGYNLKMKKLSKKELKGWAEKYCSNKELKEAVKKY